MKANKTIRRTRRLDHNRIVEETVNAIAGLDLGLTLLDANAIDPQRIMGWLEVLSESLPSVVRLEELLRERLKRDAEGGIQA